MSDKSRKWRSPRQGALTLRTDRSQETQNDSDDDPDGNPLLASECNQDARERREIRHRYRELINETAQEEDENVGIADLTGKLAEADLLFSKAVHMTREAALDSKLVNQLSTRGAQKARSLNTNLVTFHATEFAEKLANYMSPSGEEVTNWSEVGMKLSPFFKRAPSFHFMMGSFEPDNVPNAPKHPRRRTKGLVVSEKTEAPEKVAQTQKTDQEATTEEVEEMLRLLRHYCSVNNGPICLFEFLVNPTSFSQTALNFFHLTFLVKDGFAKMYLDDDDLPVVEPIQQEDDVEGACSSQSNTTEKGEIVLSMTKQEWLEIIDAFHITEALIKPKDNDNATATQS